MNGISGFDGKLILFEPWFLNSTLNSPLLINIYQSGQLLSPNIILSLSRLLVGLWQKYDELHNEQMNECMYTHTKVSCSLKDACIHNQQYSLKRQVVVTPSYDTAIEDWLLFFIAAQLFLLLWVLPPHLVVCGALLLNILTHAPPTVVVCS